MLTRISCTLLACLSATVAQAQGETPSQLADILRECGCLVAGMPAALRATPVASSIYSKDAEGFMLGFKSSLYEDVPLEVVIGDASSWKHAAFGAAPPGSAADDPRNLSGPLWEIRREGGMILVGMRAAIDGVATSILTPALERVGTVYGSVLAVLPNGFAVYQRGQVHFAPTHYSEFAVLDTGTGEEKAIYPPATPDGIRLERIERDRAEYEVRGRDWCATNNHHCDPARFDNAPWLSWQGPSHAYDAATETMAFSVVYGFDGDDKVDVVVVCTGMARLATIDCHETALSAWTESFGIGGDDRLEVLRRAAAEPGRIAP